LQSAISRAEWEELAAKKMPKLESKLYVGIKYGHDGTNVSLAIAAKAAGGKIFVEVVDCRPTRAGNDWILEFLSQADVGKVVIDGANGQQLLAGEMKEEKLKAPILPTVKEIIVANAAFEQRLYAKTLCHMNQPSLTRSVSNCEKRAIGSNGGFGYRSINDTIDVSLMDSVILASWICGESKEKKKQKRDQIFAAIGDGISALSNLYFTTQGAPNMYSGKNTASERLQVRYDRLMKERNENARAYLSGLFGAMQADDVKARDDRNWRHQLAREKRADAIADAKEKRDNQMFDLNVKLQNNKISAAEADAERKRVEAEYADDLAKARLETEKAKAGASKASASASNARAGYYNRGGSGGNKKRMTLTIDGKTTYYDTKEDYERAVQREAKRLGIKTHQYVKTTENDVMGAKEKNVSTPKPISQLAGEVETASNKKKSPTAGDNSSNKKKSPTS
jgi:hypothetical protein